jgi:hypothetical protein
MDLSLWFLHRQGLAGPPTSGPTCRLQRLLAALRLRPRRALASAEAPSACVRGSFQHNEILSSPIIILLLIAQTCLLLIAPRQGNIYAPSQPGKQKERGVHAA